MLFGSIDFAVFLPATFVLYWSIPADRVQLRNGLLLAASYLFYGWWDWRFLLLRVATSLIDYKIALGLVRATEARTRRLLLGLTLAMNVGLLAYFKYLDFFLANLSSAFTLIGLPLQLRALDVVLPIGISFYTFQIMSYSIDVYRGRIAPSRELLPFLTYVSFFPNVLAGPIERAGSLLPQFLVPRRFDYDEAVDGLRQMLWGFFKKVMIADLCAPIVDEIFANPEGFSGSTLLLGAFLFTFQIYGDFSGYSDIAIGSARLFGIRLTQNFAFPYFSRDIAEFWRRWHISLSTWFRDYLYIPLGGSHGGPGQRIRNTFAIFLVSGLWHGANWTYLAWGFLHALYFLPLLLSNTNRRHLAAVAESRALPSAGQLAQMLVTFWLATVAWIFFRADSVLVAFGYLRHMFSSSLLARPEIMSKTVVGVLILIPLMLCVEWLNRSKPHGLSIADWRIPSVIRWGGYLALAYGVLMMSTRPQKFIYFQF